MHIPCEPTLGRLNAAGGATDGHLLEIGLGRYESVICRTYNTPQKLDKGIRWMLACHTKKEGGYGKEHAESPR